MSKGVVLVTGANGYIAARTVEAFLQAGYTVRGTVRSLTSAAPVKKALAAFGDKLSFVEVPDITAPGAFDEAVKGVDAVAHLASPVSFSFTDPDPVIRTAKEGTLSALRSAAKESSVKNFVLMSSIAAVLSPKEEPYVFTEKDWNNWAIGIVTKEGKKAPGPVIYTASKAEGERVFWQFRDDQKPHFSMSAVNPVFVIGPPLVAPASADKLGETYEFIYKVYAGGDLKTAALGSNRYVDVRDVARLTVATVEHGSDTANGQRYIACSSFSTPAVVADILREAYPERAGIIQTGTIEESRVDVDGSKAEKTIGGYIPFKDSVLELAKLFANFQ